MTPKESEISNNEQARSEAYEAPQLIEYGAVQELTNATSGGIPGGI